MSRDSFVQLVREALITLPQTLKAILRMVEDPEIPDQGRVLAAGALVHWLSYAKTIPGVTGVLSYVDDVLVIGLVLGQLEAIAPEVTSRHLADLPEPLITPAKAIEVMQEYLGPVTSVLKKAATELGKLKYKGRTVEQYIGDEQASNRLYQDVQSALIELDIEESEVSQALRGLDTIFEPLRRRV
jgi:uncharacterized membrane protein YkvA (DUF1232 family)